MKRKKKTLTDVPQNISCWGPLPQHLTCRTPSPGPSSLPAPDEFESPERILRWLRNYVVGSIETGSWISKNDLWRSPEGFRRVVSWKVSLVDGSMFLHESPTAWDFIKRGFNLLQGVLTSEEPRALIFVLKWVHATYNKYPELSHMLFRHIASLATISLPSKHPIGQIFKLFAQLDGPRLKFFVLIAWRAVLTDIEKCVSDTHAALPIVNLWAEFLQSAGLAEDRQSNVETKYRELLHIYETRYSKIHSHSVSILIDLAYHLSWKGKIDEAETLLIEVIARARLLQSQTTREHEGTDVEGSRLLALNRLASIRCREQNTGKPLKLDVLCFGWAYPILISDVFLWRDWLSNWGESSWADDVRRRRIKILNSLEEDCYRVLPHTRTYDRAVEHLMG